LLYRNEKGYFQVHDHKFKAKDQYDIIISTEPYQYYRIILENSNVHVNDYCDEIYVIECIDPIIAQSIFSFINYSQPSYKPVLNCQNYLKRQNQDKMSDKLFIELHSIYLKPERVPEKLEWCIHNMLDYSQLERIN
ncbi:hypothetical protein ACFL1H_04215, partial [Nanoarchaeota archaeon]